MMNSIAVNRIVTDSQDVAQYVALESCHDEALPTLLQALKERRMVRFTYSPYWAEEPLSYFKFKPHALKMFERRWYLIGRYDDSKPHHSFALDRITDCELQEEGYERDPEFSLERMFEGVYGITVGDVQRSDVHLRDADGYNGDGHIESIWLRVEPYQANYLRSLPLHESQQEIGERGGYPVFSLRVLPSSDLKRKLLSMGSRVEVLKPESLRLEMQEEIKAIGRMYDG